MHPWEINWEIGADICIRVCPHVDSYPGGLQPTGSRESDTAEWPGTCSTGRLSALEGPMWETVRTEWVPARV